MSNSRDTIQSSDTIFPVTFYLVWGNTEGDEQRCELRPGQIVDIGRASTNRIVLRDEVCSRNHCEVIGAREGWILRDRNSRNGTSLNREPVKLDTNLNDGDLIRIGSSYILFTSDPDNILAKSEGLFDEDTETDLRMNDEPSELPKIIHRQKQSSLREDNQSSESTVRQRAGLELSRLYQMAMKMGNVETVSKLSEIVLDSLVGITGADIGAVLTMPHFDSVKQGSKNVVSQLINTAYQSLEGKPYQPVSLSLSEQVFVSAEAILGRDSDQPGNLAERDSVDDLQAQSLIIAPIINEGNIFGLIHLYSTNPENELDENDLDYTLAVADHLAVAMEHLKQKLDLEDGIEKIQNENQQLKHQLEIETELVGESPQMEDLNSKIGLVAPTNAVVLIRGESGAGKELVARAIHYNSKRKAFPFVCMNCAALSESLLESELFGHEKGSFTGATDQKQGKFEQADKGTLFLDEVGEMSQAIQAKFLRVLEGHPFERVGGAKSIEVDVRLVAATNRDLEEAVRQSKFREDLYFRLQVFEIVVPPLREREGDIPILADFFAERFAEKTGRPVKQFTADAMDRLANHQWAGNVRELQNAVERAVVLSTDDVISITQIQLSGLNKLQPEVNSPAQDQQETSGKLAMSMDELEKNHIQNILQLTDGNKSKASQILGIERSTLDRKLKKYGLKNPGK